jgi:hypothetical protein
MLTHILVSQHIEHVLEDVVTSLGVVDPLQAEYQLVLSMGILPIDNELLPIIQPSKHHSQCVEHVVDVGDLSWEVPGALQAKY